MLTEEHFMENSADPSTKSSVGKLFGDLTYISTTRIVFLKRTFCCMTNTVQRRVSRRQSALLFQDRTNSLDSPHTKVKLIGNLIVIFRNENCMFNCYLVSISYFWFNILLQLVQLFFPMNQSVVSSMLFWWIIFSLPMKRVSLQAKISTGKETVEQIFIYLVWTIYQRKYL